MITLFTTPEGRGIRVFERNGNPWFCAADVCAALGIKNTSAAMNRLGADEQTLVRNETQAQRAAPYWKAVSESGLYKLVMRCDKSVAAPFQDWVTREVLPAIRKDGAYIMGEEKVKTGEMSEDELVLKALTVLQAKVQRLTKERDEALFEINLVTVDEYRALTHRYMTHSEKVRLGQTAARIAKARGVPLQRQCRTITDTWGVRHETSINVYPRDILVEAEQALSMGR